MKKEIELFTSTTAMQILKFIDQELIYNHDLNNVETVAF